MEKRYVILLSIIMLAVIFTTFMLLTENQYDTQIETLVDYEKKEDIIFFSSWAGYDTKADAVDMVLADFQKDNENIEVINKSTGGEDFLFSLKADFASGKDPDVFGLWPGSDIELLIDRGKVQSLDETMEADPEWKESLGHLGWDLVTYSGKIYGVPMEVIYEGLFINKDIFDKLNLKEPKTYGELKACVKVLKENGYVPIAYNATPEGSFIYQNIVLSLGGRTDIENPFDENGQIRQCFIDGMYYMKELYDLGAFPEDYLGLSDYERNQLFINKEAGMIVQGSWFIGDNYVNPDAEDVTIIPIPTFDTSKTGPRAITYGLGNGVFHISTSAWNNEAKRDLAVALLKRLTSVEAATRLVNETGTQVNVNLSPDLIDAPKMYYEGRELVQNATDRIGPVDSYIRRSLWEDIVIENFYAIYQEEKSPEEVFDEVEAANRQ